MLINRRNSIQAPFFPGAFAFKVFIICLWVVVGSSPVPASNKGGLSPTESISHVENFREGSGTRPDPYRRPFISPNDSEFHRQWAHLNRAQTLPGTFPAISGSLDVDIRSTEAWTLAKGKPGMIIAVIDSGIDPRHPDFLNEDLNYNGQLDIDEDTNRNFLLDPGEDFNGNGLLDTNEDINSNKILDAGEDFNGNGVLDTDEDLNQNRVLDPGEDLNGNGEVDTREDINGNGILDPGRIWVNADELPGDHNGDGCPGACGVDDDGDGLVDEDSRGREPGHPDYSGDTVLDDDENGLADDFQGWNFFGNRKCAVVENRCSCESGPSTGNNNVADDFGHGTAVAGVVAGHADNQFGISGVLWDARIMPLKVMDGNGCMTIDDEAAAIDYAVENGAQIIIIASGGGVFQQEEFEAIQRAESAGILVVAPAGNDGSNNDLVPVYPASYDLKNILSIAATDINDGLYFQSNFGVHSVDLGAPGECIYTTLPLGSFSLQSRTNFNCTGLPFQPGFDYVSGTSFAAGFAAGGAGLLLTLNPFISLEELKALILLGVDPVEGLKGRVVSGGRLNLHQALTGEPGSTFSGGSGGSIGCGAFFFPPGSGEGPWRGGLVGVVVLLVPLLLALRRFRKTGVYYMRKVSFFMLGISFFVSLMGMPLIASAQESAAGPAPLPFKPKEGKHFLSIKGGFHAYRNSEYFSTNSAFFDERDFFTPIGEIEYEYLVHKWARIGFAAGYYGGEAAFEKVCCTEMSFNTLYLLASIKLEYHIRFARIPPVRLFAGPGLGFYRFKRTIRTSGQTDRFEENFDGFHFSGGMGVPILRNIILFTEGRYTSARIKSANQFNDTLDIGGLSGFIGLSWVLG